MKAILLQLGKLSKLTECQAKNILEHTFLIYHLSLSYSYTFLTDAIP